MDGICDWANQLTQPVVHPEVGLGVEQHRVLDTDDTREQVQAAHGHGEANVGQHNVGSFAAAEDGAARVEVALAEQAGGALETALARRDVEAQVGDPAEQLVEEQGDELVRGGVLEELDVVKGLLEVVGARLGHKGHVLLHVAGVHVMAVVGELPRVEGDHESGVAEEADDVVEARVHGEGAVAGLVA